MSDIPEVAYPQYSLSTRSQMCTKLLLEPILDPFHGLLGGRTWDWSFVTNIFKKTLTFEGTKIEEKIYTIKQSLSMWQGPFAKFVDGKYSKTQVHAGYDKMGPWGMKG